MLKNLSYLNLILSVVYFLSYLQNAGYWVVSGLLSVIVFNWLTLLSLDREQIKWFVFQWFFGAITLLFALYIGYSALQLLLDAVEHSYYPGATVGLVAAGILFTLLLLFHLFLSRAKKE
ncbi:hypothetical protein [Pedobacter sp. L105]|uniref:hypothetical protein n=1 Tax=Pedobacter sp. L105 TaxID=1641871 RepID=UPI00131D7B97|nr:hypothetical protein [Pedobacter sp. L105]